MNVKENKKDIDYIRGYKEAEAIAEAVYVLLKRVPRKNSSVYWLDGYHDALNDTLQFYTER